jgi:hypothetical protein
MKTAHIGLLLLSIIAGCNQNQSPKSEIVSEKSDEIIGPIIIAQTNTNNGTKNGYGCNFVKGNKDDSLAKKIILSHELVETVVREIDNKDNIENFWSYLTIPTKQNLIYELSLNLLNFSKQSELPFRSVAVFLGELAKSNSFSNSYLIKERDGAPFKFQVNGESIQEIYSLDESCEQKYLDFSTILLTKEITSAANLSESFICRSNRDHFEILVFKESLYFASRMDIIEIPKNRLNRKETNEEIVLSIQENSEIKLKMKLNKKQFVTSQGRNAFKTKVKIESPTLDLSTVLTCERVIKN